MNRNIGVLLDSDKRCRQRGAASLLLYCSLVGLLLPTGGHAQTESLEPQNLQMEALDDGRATPPLLKPTGLMDSGGPLEQPERPLEQPAGSMVSDGGLAREPAEACAGLRVEHARLLRALRLLETLNVQRADESKRRIPILRPKTGEVLQLGDIVRGRPAVIHFISLPCKPCEREWPQVVRSLESIKEIGLVPLIVGLAPRETALELVQYYERIARDLGASPDIVISTDDSLLEAYKLSAATPQTFIVDEQLDLIGKPWVGEKAELWMAPSQLFANTLLKGKGAERVVRDPDRADGTRNQRPQTKGKPAVGLREGPGGSQRIRATQPGTTRGGKE